MSLTPGTTLGAYEVRGSLGAGGMGEVYRARDTRLNRDVAIKVLPEVFAGDAERLARFTREAQTLAALNHPNIAAIYGLEEFPAGPGHAGGRALIMELVEGDDLSAVITRARSSAGAEAPALHRQPAPALHQRSQSKWSPGASGPGIPLADALAIARQIADALEAAHEQGIVHRDLKPGNVKVRPDGTVKVLDFGLAKAMDAGAATSGDLMNSPTLTAQATQAGMILGTAAYMAPEQARGRPVDKRADIWAFGVVLYEMLTGRRAFQGEDVSTTLAAVLTYEPDLAALPDGTPRAIRALVARCLAKDPRQRLRDIGDGRHAIDEILAGRPSEVETPAAPLVPAATAPGWLRALPWAAAAVFAIAAAALWVQGGSPSVAARPVHVEINLPAEVEFFSGPSLSEDGTTLAFVGVRLGIRQVFRRSLGERDVRPVTGTETAVTVAVSPDGRSAAFVTNDTRLKHISFDTGVVEPIADGVSIYSAAAWLGDGSIVFSRGDRLTLRRPGGTERDLARIDAAAGEVSLLWPVVTTGDRFVLFRAGRMGATAAESRLEAVPVAGGDRKVVVDGAGQAVFASADRLVYERDTALFIVPFDASRAETTGTAVRLAETSAHGPISGVSAAIAPSGTAVFVPPSVFEGHLLWVSMTGADRPVRGPVRGYLNPRVSPDGRLIAFSEAGTIWTLDPERGTFTRVSSTTEANVGFPYWSRDGRNVYYRSSEGIRFQSADGEGVSTLLPNTNSMDYPNSFTPDGSTLVLLRLSAETGGDLYTTPATGGEVKPLLVTKAYEGGAQVSPDGKWLLYVTNESGRMEVALRPMSGPDRKWPVSTEGGMHPGWSRDGRRIFYRVGPRFLAVDVTTSPDLRLGRPDVLFEKRFAFGQNITIPNYGLSADGREFLLVQEEAGGRHLNLTLNWLPHAGR